METAQVACPQCRAVLRSPAPLPVGAKVQCSACGLKFFVGADRPVPAGQTPNGALVAGQPPPMAAIGNRTAPPSAPMFFPTEGPPRGWSVWVFLVPAVLILLVGGGAVALILVLNSDRPSDNAVVEDRDNSAADRDKRAGDKPADTRAKSKDKDRSEDQTRVRVDDGPAVVDIPVDPDPRIALKFLDPGTKERNKGMSFGIMTTRDKKKLTYAEDGFTSNTVLRIDYNKEMGFGSTEKGKWIERDGALGKDRQGRQRSGSRSVWMSGTDDIQVTQTAEIVPSVQAVDIGSGKQVRLLDTCLVRYKIENKGAQEHIVGIRFMLDTYIGNNDGVPFTIPGQQELCSTMKKLEGNDIPDFVQALERSDLKNPGTIAQLTLKVGGGLEIPERVLLTHWPGTSDGWSGWDVPLVPITQNTPDSAIAMFWKEQALKPGQSRTVGFAYGLGTIASTEGAGKLGVTLGGNFEPRGVFTVTAYVTNPARDETLTLTLPPGLTRVEGEAQQPVPPLPPDAKSKNSVVTWKVRVERFGKFSLKVASSTGLSQTKTITVSRGGKLLPDP